MTQLVALVSLLVLGFVIALGNYWFTFGLWPLSWWSFFGFGAASICSHLLLVKVNSEVKKGSR